MSRDSSRSPSVDAWTRTRVSRVPCALRWASRCAVYGIGAPGWVMTRRRNQRARATGGGGGGRRRAPTMPRALFDDDDDDDGVWGGGARDDRARGGRATATDASDDDGRSSSSASDLRVNAAYAARYEHNERRKEMHRLQAKLEREYATTALGASRGGGGRRDRAARRRRGARIERIERDGER